MTAGVAALLLLLARAATAHVEAPAEVAAAIASPAAQVAWNVVSAAPDAKQARLLIVRVGPAWGALAPDVRTRTADAWLARWRHAVPQGIVAILDDATGAPVVNYDATGHARLVAP